MKISIYILLVVIVLLGITINHKVNSLDADLSSCLALNYVVCGLTVGSAVYKQYASWSDVDTKQAFGTTCNSQFKGGIHDWEWKWSGKFWCPSLSPTVMGESTQYASRTGAIEHAVQDYVTKMTSAGLLKPEQLNT
ncbi:unnamed protein product [Adineta steineri]|uniref:Uncharacterized protein n=1 Tax=Adineta steineri TaxID=433720 RepID=A0A814RNL0_9BILA|nr:unnamed protein product [Adineta steineri]